VLTVIFSFFMTALAGNVPRNPVNCTSNTPGGPFHITADCVDPIYGNPVIDDSTTYTNLSVPHHVVFGHFEGTPTRFRIYFPPPETWKGRFFHYVYPIQTEVADDWRVNFNAESGAYTVQILGTNGYRADAAAAKFSKTVAAEYYNTSRQIYGYAYGGSGGSYQAVGLVENTEGVWDGALVFIQAVPVSIPDNIAIRSLASLVLVNKSSELADAVSPGSGIDPFSLLDEVESEILHEATTMGVPLRGWEDFRYMSNSGLLVAFRGGVQLQVPSYADDFWSKPGYLGAEQSKLGDIIRASKIEVVATIQAVEREGPESPVNVTLDKIPDTSDPSVFDFRLRFANGTLQDGLLSASLNNLTKVLTIRPTNAPEVLAAITQGLEVVIDNRWHIALHELHRHQVPERPGFYGFDQFTDAAGRPIYPQLPVNIAQTYSVSNSGNGTHTGEILSKLIVVDNLLDLDAFPWHADWYKNVVKQALGDRFEDNYRLWYNDHADHSTTIERPNRLVDYLGTLMQGLRDLSLWVEEDIPAPASTHYEVSDSQIVVPPNAKERLGIQPTIELTVNGAVRVETKVGTSVDFSAVVQLPPGTGEVVQIDWDFFGTGNFTTTAFVPTEQGALVNATFAYDAPGRYLPILRATAQRDPTSEFAKILNIGRVRVVVSN
jgi:hypothetical protein